MLKIIWLSAALLISCGLVAQVSTSYDFASTNTGDTYTITIKTPAGYDSTKSYKLVYVADGSIKMGRYILGIDKNWAAAIPNDCVVVAIGHQHGHTMQRERDFIPSDAGGYNTKQFGQAQKFYLFLKNELLPHINKKIPHQKLKAFIGHSFSGLFCLYTSLQPDKLFDKHFAISPSVWANYHELLRIEKIYAAANKSLQAQVYIWVGSLEVFNKVLSSATEYYNTVKAREYKGCSIQFQTIQWANHISILKPAIDDIMQKL